MSLRSRHVSEAEALDAYSTIVTRIAEKLAPSVTNLAVYRKVRGGRRMSGSGSGVVITSDGFVLTSAHVVAGSDGGNASFSDGRETSFEIVGADPLSDLAVVRARSDDLVPAELGDASRLKVGQLVVAIGNPLGFGGTVTAGVVGAVGRSFVTQSNGTARFVENVIQTDAALHPGNSGGALVESGGTVVGINTALVGPGMGQGLGLAVPVNETTLKIVSALMTEGRVRRAWFGVAGGSRPLPPRVAREVGRERGIEVVQVVPGSPAEAAGLRPEDLIVEVHGTPVEGMDDLQRLMDGSLAGRSIEIAVYRDRLLRLPITPAELAA
ncbi:MAG: trypsin-like peptidase domain-containing protein [Actinomycetota bacterium]|nr:trypsin-like peptidase domain-containing protein [Actinomycetota bacterium]